MKARFKTLVSLAMAAALVASSVPRVQAQEADTVELGLSDVLTRALESNLDLALAKKDPVIADYNVTFEKAAFDPILGVNANHYASRTRQNQINFSSVVPTVTVSETRRINDAIDPSISGRVPFGATYSLAAHYDTTGPSVLGQTFGQDTTGNPLLISELDQDRAKHWWYDLTATLPLLKGFGRAVNEAPLLIAKHNVNISHLELARQAQITAKTAEDAYWDLLATKEAQKVAEQALQLANELYDLNKKKVEVGTLAPIEITQAEANVASNVEGVIRTKEAVKNAEDVLRRILAVPVEDPLWSKTIMPTEKPVSDQRQFDLDEALGTAMERRPEIAAAKEGLEITKINENAAHNEVKHQLDLVGLWRRTHDESPETISVFAPPPSAVTSVPVGFRIAPEWSIGLKYVYPFGNRAAKATYATATINREKQETTVASITQDVRVDVRTAFRAVESGYERVVAARKNVELQQKKLDAEQKKFDNGMSTSFEVFTFQTDLRNAQLSLIQAVLDYNKALSDLERAKGTLLEAKGLKLDENAGRKE